MLTMSFLKEATRAVVYFWFWRQSLTMNFRLVSNLQSFCFGLPMLGL